MSHSSRLKHPRIVLLALLFVVVAGCNRRQMQMVSPAYSSEEGSFEQIELHVSGGFAGLNRFVEVKNNKKILVVDKKTKRKISGTVDPGLFAELVSSLPTTTVKQHKPLQPDCADCFYYQLKINRGNGKSEIVMLNSRTLAESPYKAGVSILQKIIKRQLTKTP